MAQAQLIFDESALDKSSPLYDLYSRFYQGMEAANRVDAPDFSQNPPTTPEGEIDADAIKASLSEYSAILMKNSAYMMANSIISVSDSGGIGDTSGCISRSGDSMDGRLDALYGFSAGNGGIPIFETSIGTDDKKNAFVYGDLHVDGDVEVKGALRLSDQGIWVSAVNVLSYADDTLSLKSAKILLTGEVGVSDKIKVGNVVINGNGIYKDNAEYYYSGNSNKEDIDWSMRDAHVYRNLIIEKDAEFKGILKALSGFSLGAKGERLLFSVSEENEDAYVQLSSDLFLLPGYGIKLDGKYIVKVRAGADNIVSFSAPGMVMNLGDSDGDTATTGIALQTGIFNHNSDYRIISQYGDGNFPNSFSAGCGNAGPTVLNTYYRSTSDCGVVSRKRIRFGSDEGPSLSSDDAGSGLLFIAPYLHVTGDTDNPVQKKEEINAALSYRETTSLFRDQSKEWSASLRLDTDGEFFSFGKPVESGYFSIISERYKTRLSENVLFFSDGTFLEGVEDGISHNGNAYFSAALGSVRFASGFSGYGWRIGENGLYGGVSATFDELEIRKKMRVYELEVQKDSVTNGALWVSDSCSGDLVEEIV